MYWFTGITGIIFMFAPYLFSYSDNQPALWTSLILGLIVVAASVWEGVETKKENWEYWTATIVGIFAILAPFAFGFGSLTSAMWTTVLMGAVIAILAGGKLWLGKAI